MGRANRCEFSHLLSGTGLGNSQTDAKDGVGTKLGLVGLAIKLVQESIDLGLVLDVNTLFDQGRANDLVDVVDSLGDALATPLGLVAVSKFASLMLSCLRRVKQLRDAVWSRDRNEPVEAPDGTMARCRPVSVTRSTSTVGLPRESYTERA